MELLNEALRSPKHKTCFSFALKCLQDFIFALPFWYGQIEIGQNGQNDNPVKLKSYGYFRAKLKHVL